MKYNRIRSAYDSTLPDEGTKERMLQRLLDAASGPQPGRSAAAIRSTKIKRVVIIPLAAVLALILAGAALAYTGAVTDTFGLWFGQQKVELDPLSPVSLDLDAFIRYAEERPEEEDISYVAQFVDSFDFTEKTGMVLSDISRIGMVNVHVGISDRYRTGHITMEVLLNGQRYPMDGMFLLEGNTQTDYGYGVEAKKAYYVYEYAEGRKAYFVRDGIFDNVMAVYFTENGVMYQLFVENSKAGKELGKEIVARMAGLAEP